MQAVPATARAQAQQDDLRVVLDGVEPPVAGLRVQVFDDTVAPQLVLENQSGQALEILDEQGRAFVRIRPGGVDADLAAAGWYASFSPGGAPLPAAARAPDARPNWRAVRAQPAWGWFDPRLSKSRAAEASAAGEAGRWSVPARLGEEAIEIRGHFRYEPRPTGVFVARLTIGRELAPKVRVTLSPGRPPTLLLENNGAEPVSVLGDDGQPFLRISVDGVEANLASATWQDLGRYRGFEGAGVAASGGAPRWQRVSLAPRYGWLEPRAGMPSVGPGARAPDNARARVKGWQVPVDVGSRRLAIQGVVEWVPLPSAIDPVAQH